MSYQINFFCLLDQRAAVSPRVTEWIGQVMLSYQGEQWLAHWNG